jgi:hypothetical protein
VTQFANGLTTVWNNVAVVSRPGAWLVIRFGGIGQSNVTPKELMMRSLNDTLWDVFDILSAGYASDGRRQKMQFRRGKSLGLEEWDVWAIHRK